MWIFLGFTTSLEFSLTVGSQNQGGKKNTKTILSALHQLILKLNLGILNWHQQVRTWFSQFNISSWMVKKHQISLAPHYVEIVIYHDIPTRPVCILLICSYFVCNFHYIFWFPAGDMKTWDIFLFFILFLLSYFDHSKCSLLEWVDGVKLYTDSS